MIDYMDFSGKCAVVTGGRRGLGREISIELAERGAKVAVIAQNPDGEDILEALKKAGWIFPFRSRRGLQDDRAF